MVSSLLFALAHVLTRFNPFFSSFNLDWWWGLYTFFGGLFFGLIREKTNSFISSGIAHSLPEALAEGFTFILI